MDDADPQQTRSEVEFMTRHPYERNAGSSSNRGRRLRADEIRRDRMARSAPVAGRPAQSQRYQPRMSEQFPAVADNQPKKRWTPLRLGLLAVGLSLVMLAAIVVVPVLIQMQRTADQVFQDADPIIDIVDNPDGTPVIVTQEPDGRSVGFDDDDFDDESADLPSWDGSEKITIALYGVDSREEGELARSDTIILVVIDPETNEVGMMSIPRDLQVDIPGLGREKINAAYAQGGRALTRAVIEYHFDIPVHYYAEVDFNGFINIVDTMGGVVVDNPAVLKDDNYEWTRVYFPTGPQFMDGETALRYVRTRYDDNDFARGQRQQQVLRAMREQGVRLNLITQVRSLLRDVEENFRTDLSMRQSLALARIAADISNEDIESYSIIECTTEDYVPDLYYYLVPDWDCIHDQMHEIFPQRDVEPEELIDYDAPIVVENGTFIDGLAGRSRDTLLTAGYSSVDARQSDEAGDVPTSIIRGGTGVSEDTLIDIAEQLGFVPDIVDIEHGSTNVPDDYSIIVILGDDAPEPD
jgi:polyisoprenyl-teichoic acid--peptidoglycan teichoic acid transferase